VLFDRDTQERHDTDTMLSTTSPSSCQCNARLSHTSSTAHTIAADGSESINYSS